MIRLDHNRAVSQIAAKAGVPVHDIAVANRSQN
jgi:hypothetical protein